MTNYFKFASLVLASIFLASCNSSGGIDLSSAVQNQNSTGTLYFALSGGAISCKRPKFVFGKLEKNAYRTVNLGKGLTTKNRYVRVTAPAGTYALLSAKCATSNGSRTLGTDIVGKDKNLYRSGLGQFNLSAGDAINGGVVTSTTISRGGRRLKGFAVTVIVPMSAAQKTELAKYFPEARSLSQRLIKRETRSSSQKAYSDCLTKWILAAPDKRGDINSCAHLKPT